jgi:hypothetical protein
MRSLSCFNFAFLNVVIFASHDASHLIVYPCLLCSILYWATSQSKDCDDSVSSEESLIVDRVVSFLKEMVLIGIIILYSDFPVYHLLSQEGASMRENFSIDETRARNSNLSVFASLN